MNGYAALADAVLVVHVLFVAFVVAGQGAILAGLWRHWHWVRNLTFRLAHLLAIGVVVLQSWLGMLCPLTVVESEFRRRAGQPVYAESFIAYWLHRVLYYQADEWVFTALYSAFGALVALTWIYGRPAR
jgi:hypothetical protein